MTYCKVTAIINRLALEPVEHALVKAGATGVSVSTVKGFGELPNFFSRDWMIRHVKVEVFAPVEQGDTLAQAIIGAAHTGCEGDGIVVITPVDKVYHIRTCGTDLSA